MSDSHLLSLVLATSFLLIVANITLYISKKIDFPFAVLLVVIGAIIFPFRDNISFLKDLALTPELLFFVFLPILLFESAFNIDFRKLRKDLTIVTSLSILGVIISTFVVGLLVSWYLKLPFIVSLIFAAIISSTDPIAVIAIFKQLGVPKRLVQMIDSESMLNDGTSVIFSKIVLSFFATGFAASSMLDHFQNFAYVIFGSIIFGFLIGLLVAHVIEAIKNDFLIEISITLATSYLVFIISEEFLHMSGIIATVTAAMTIGNYGRDTFSAHVKKFLKEIWEYFAFIANSLVFLLVGMSFGLNNILASWKEVLAAYLITLVGRGVAVYLLCGLHNVFNKESIIPFSWMHILTWGGLRGALPIAVVLSLPGIESPLLGKLSIYQDQLLTVTVGVVLLSLIVNGFTIKWLAKFLQIDKLNTRETVETHLIKTYVLKKAIQRIKYLEKIGELSGKYGLLNKRFLQDFHTTVRQLKHSFQENKEDTLKALYSYTFQVEKEVFCKLHEKGIITRKILKRLEEKLLEGLDLIDKGIFPAEFSQNKSMQKISKYSKKGLAIPELYIYRKAREFANLEVLEQFETFRSIDSLKHCVEEVIVTYHKLYEKNKRVCKKLENENYKEIASCEEKLCLSEMLATEEDIISDLESQGKLSPAVAKELQSTLVSLGV